MNVSTVKRSPHATDRHVGNRVRMRRKMQGMTQEKLAKALGLTFQQVQKYEKGTNRIGPVACNISLQFSRSQSLSSSKMRPDHRPSWTSLATMSPASSPPRTGSRSRKPICISETLSSGAPLLLWLSRWPEKTNLNRSRCRSFDRVLTLPGNPRPPIRARRANHARRR